MTALRKPDDVHGSVPPDASTLLRVGHQTQSSCASIHSDLSPDSYRTVNGCGGFFSASSLSVAFVASRMTVPPNAPTNRGANCGRALRIGVVQPQARPPFPRHPEGIGDAARAVRVLLREYRGLSCCEYPIRRRMRRLKSGDAGCRTGTLSSLHRNSAMFAGFCGRTRLPRVSQRSANETNGPRSAGWPANSSRRSLSCSPSSTRCSSVEIRGATSTAVLAIQGRPATANTSAQASAKSADAGRVQDRKSVSTLPPFLRRSV